MEADRPQPVVGMIPTAGGGPATSSATTPTAKPGPAVVPVAPVEVPKLKRFHGTIELDPQRVGRDAGKVAEEVIAHLSSLLGSMALRRLIIAFIVRVTPRRWPDRRICTPLISAPL